MSNEILFILSIAATFSAIVVVTKLFGKEGLLAWAALVPVLANMLVVKQITLLGLHATLGNIIFASSFLCTDILSERYGMEASRRAVQISLFSAIAFIAVTQTALLFTPNELDTISGAMRDMFTMAARTTMASVTMFFLANMADIYLFEALKKRFPKALWLRNNVASIACNCSENFLFVLAAFYGIYSFSDCMSIAAATSIIEAIIAVCDTPFVYAARKI